ncbi:hypothetical protein M8J71_15530 [Pseudarthrobacter sp. R1]|uniref:hypothetical protein n=1 Tax=Pseudarthrobacter sp. R1 TaxID=2944934 RepID=UPI00210DAD8E|nr:hypothetical protein [Pseudarthrobacter sp. R1]MCQ6271887.1 hypothetical protein [Pseudarthrobacter sp. R1]
MVDQATQDETENTHHHRGEDGPVQPGAGDAKVHGAGGVVLIPGFLFLSATGLTWSGLADNNVTSLRTSLNWTTPSPPRTPVSTSYSATRLSWPEASLAATHVVEMTAHPRHSLGRREGSGPALAARHRGPSRPPSV